MSYSDGIVMTYTFDEETDFALATNSIIIKPPGDFENGRLMDIGLHNVSIAFLTDTTDAQIQVGDGTDPDRYGFIPLADGLAVGAATSTIDNITTDPVDTKGFGPNDQYITLSDLTDNELVITFLQGVHSGAETGTGTPYIAVRWF